MAQKDSAFEALPIELHFQVLSHMSTPEDVLSTIQAIPAALRAFQTGRERIYAAVLETSLGPEVFRELLAIVNAPDHNQCPKAGPPQPAAESAEARDSALAKWKSWEQKVTDFLRSHAHGAVYPIPRSTNYSAQMKFMVRLYFCLWKLVNLFPSFVKCKATHTKLAFPHASTFMFGRRAQEDHESPRLTNTELLRVRRGLLRYELCCRLIGMTSFAAVCNEELYVDASIALTSEQFEFWYGNPFCSLLPVDEVEEIVCASVYVGDLYCSLHVSFIEEFENVILDTNQNAVKGVPENGMSGSKKKTVEEWLSNDDLAWYTSTWHQGELGSRLGLVFLGRVIQSTLADRRGLMRSTFHAFRGLLCDTFLQPHWNRFHKRRVVMEGGSLELGPYCNPMLRTFSNDERLIQMLGSYATFSLRRLGWVLLDDLSRFRALGLPLEAKASWFTDEALQQIEPRLHRAMSSSALTVLLTEDEWRNLSAKNYTRRDRQDDFEAMTRFVAGARAVVDLTSNQLPRMD